MQVLPSLLPASPHPGSTLMHWACSPSPPLPPPTVGLDSSQGPVAIRACSPSSALTEPLPAEHLLHASLVQPYTPQAPVVRAQPYPDPDPGEPQPWGRTPGSLTYENRRGEEGAEEAAQVRALPRSPRHELAGSCRGSRLQGRGRGVGSGGGGSVPVPTHRISASRRRVEGARARLGLLPGRRSRYMLLARPRGRLRFVRTNYFPDSQPLGAPQIPGEVSSAAADPIRR